MSAASLVWMIGVVAVAVGIAGLVAGGWWTVAVGGAAAVAVGAAVDVMEGR